ncbi:right-handed parallel beta-helix repeat-containing protein [Dyadobacter sp. CY343]|uniref:right-handed parallel beta-helix repeat-containing protein n=1 Tax=Dyadobacter sp. CY343 TaxID=2907299 RepID=UPI001F1FFE8D|nr:right-handed parallel beta-helix repeat-containing protein [Dyadobacter sp. CY343]MCE7058626.1 hypothetical protein [Dyadobacter sp. CY343]
MYNKLLCARLQSTIGLLICLFFISSSLLSARGSAIDPIRFSVTTTATNVGLNEEFQIDIKASYLSVPGNVAFVFEGANAFRLKMILPVGFEQTGGDFTDFVGTQLSSQKPYVHYTLKGKFVSDAGDGLFQLLRSHKNANNQSTFTQVCTLNFKMDVANSLAADTEENARVAATPTPGYIPYLTIAEVRAGVADTAKAVFVTDKGKYGLFRHNPESTRPDDGSIVLLTGSKRYERVYEGAVNVEWFGVVADGTTDQSAKIQVILNNEKYRNVYFPKAAASYRIKTLRIYSNSTLTFEEGTVVEGMGTLGTYERMITIYDASNIVIRAHNCVFKDHREKYTTGQWRHIFSIEGLTNGLFEGMTAESSGGDGFYIGAASVKKFSEHVKLVNVKSHNNRRQGITVVSGKHIDIVNPIVSNSNGEAPSSGIDIEPGSGDFFLDKIRIDNPTTSGNTGPGIIISPGALSNTGKVIDIIVTNHIDDGSQYGCLVTTVAGPLLGSVIIDKPIWKNSRISAFVARNWSYRACSVQVLNPVVLNPNTSKNTSPNLGAAFLIYRAATDGGDSNIGNIHIVRPQITETRSPQQVTTSFCFRDLKDGSRIYNCSVIDPVKPEAASNYKHIIAHNAEVTVSDISNSITTDFGSYNKVVGIGYYTPLFHNLNSSAARILTMEKVNPNFPEVTVEVRKGLAIRIQPHATDNILPLSSTAGKYITSNVVGSRIILKKSSDNSWTVKEMVGTWTVQP